MTILRAFVARTKVARMTTQIRCSERQSTSERLCRRYVTGVSQSADSRDDVVISGLSGRLPESDNIAEFRDNLLKGFDMVTEDGRRWEPSK
jgi:hypothetical protein